ncbi:MAG: hypothetical protein OXE77_07270 [Flavobacteriaceae bacterium]|nr:hypothetical protein [Flavobacteriaceae bacterium]MCY4267035.1 hypothetical protein [Flavobacteriaceae bacterium]
MICKKRRQNALFYIEKCAVCIDFKGEAITDNSILLLEDTERQTNYIRGFSR